MAYLIFRIADGETEPGTTVGKTGVAWVLRFGGLMALVSGNCKYNRVGRADKTQIGALISRKVPPTKTEKVSQSPTSAT